MGGTCSTNRKKKGREYVIGEKVGGKETTRKTNTEVGE
jgi:hypothetical protein